MCGSTVVLYCMQTTPAFDMHWCTQEHSALGLMHRQSYDIQLKVQAASA
jgi:hypothetical protein